MVVFAVLLVAAAVVLGIYASANSGSHDVSLFGTSYNVYDWAPPVIAAAVIGLLLLLCIAYASIRMSKLRRTNLALRGELDKMRMELDTARQTREREVEAVPVARREPVGPVAEREVVGREDPRLHGHESDRLREMDRQAEPATMAAERQPATDTGDPRVGEVPAHGYAPNGNPDYAPQGHPGYAPQGHPGYAPNGNQGYTPAEAPGYAPDGRPVERRP